MLRKTTAAVVLAGALALGTASATSLGTFDDVSFAASDVTLDTCAVMSAVDLLALVPAIPEVGDVVGDEATADELVPTGGTLLLDTIDINSMIDQLPADCTGELADLVLLDATKVVATVTGIDISQSAQNAGDISPVSITDTVDIGVVTSARLVVRSDGDNVDDTAN